MCGVWRVVCGVCGTGLLYVDASQKANIGSSCSHSCDANCTSSIVARNGRLTIAMTTVSRSRAVVVGGVRVRVRCVCLGRCLTGRIAVGRCVSV